MHSYTARAKYGKRVYKVEACGMESAIDELELLIDQDVIVVNQSPTIAFVYSDTERFEISKD